MSRKKIHQNFKRKSQKIAKMETILKELQQHNLVSQENADFLDAISGPNKLIISRQAAKLSGNPLKRAYCPELKAFALNLNFISPKAYNYVRESFSSCLPHIKSISRWYKTVNCNPGFTSEAFQVIKNAVTAADCQLVVNITFDEINIRNQIQWNGNESTGYVDMGDGGQSNVEATQILVFMVVFINRSWKIPIGYFPIASLTALQKKNLIEHCIRNVIETGAAVIGVTFDGVHANIAAVKSLECDLQDTKSLNTFTIDNKSAKISALLDPCHMLKLIRNAFHDLKIIIDENGNKIDWKYLKLLLELQESEELHMGNKL